jgi:acetyl-CoA C-acetyltransferase
MILGDLESVSQRGGNSAFITGAAGISDTYWVGDRLVPTAEVSLVDFEITKLAGDKAFRQAGITKAASEIDVAELYDPYSTLGFMQLEQLGFCAPGEAARLERDGAWSMDGGLVAVNPSGGTLCSNPIAIAGLARAIDAARQVMGTAGASQVPGVRRAISTANGGIFQFQNVTVFANDHN